MAQYKYQVKKGVKWMVKFNYSDPKTGKTKTEYKRGFESKREAREYEDEFLENLTADSGEEDPLYERTFEDVFHEYLMSHKREDIKDSTLQTKYNIFEKHIFPTFRNVLISEITDDDIAEWQAKMKNFVMPNGKHFSKSFLRTIQSQFNSIINYANSKGYLNQNPLADIKNMGIKDKRVEFWSTSEYERFAYCAMKYPNYYYAFEVLYWCGLREGDDDDKIRLNQRKPSKYKGLRRFGPEKNLQRINKFMKERPIFYKNLIQMKENIRFYLRCFYCITKVMILQFNSENRTELARNG